MELNFKQKLKHISCFILDVDGVLTDGSLMLFPGGDQVRKMNIRDGYAIQAAIKAGYKVAVISGGKSEGVKTRLAGLGMTDIFLGVDDKTEKFDELLSKYNLKTENVLYMGDDLPDLVVMKKSGVPVCPADAAHEIKEISIYISGKKGGEGCVRDIIEQVMRLHGKWFAV